MAQNRKPYVAFLMKQLILILLTSLIFGSCGPKTIKTPDNAMDKFSEFKKQEKFVQDNAKFYPGISNPDLKSILTEKINLAADDFKEVSLTKNPMDKDYQDKIKIGLQRFNDNYLDLDTEDRERVCLYFEELMDIVGLESSGGHLNEWMYGFDPTDKK